MNSTSGRSAHAQAGMQAHRRKRLCGRSHLNQEPAETPHPCHESGAIKSEAMTERYFPNLPGGGVRNRPLQVLGIETLELQPAVWTNDLPQIWQRIGQTRNLHSKCLLTGGTAGKRVSALHKKVSLNTRADLRCYHPAGANANPRHAPKVMAHIIEPNGRRP